MGAARPPARARRRSDQLRLNRTLVTGSALVVGAASLFGTLSLIAREVGALGLDSVSFVAWRAAIGGVAIGALIAVGAGVGYRRTAGNRNLGLRGRVGGLSIGQKRALLLGGVLGALLNIAMFAAFQRMSIAVALVSFYTFPALVTVAAVPVYGERLQPRQLAALTLSIGGLLLVLLAPLAEAGGGLVIDPFGVALALFAAVCQTMWFLLAGRGFRPLSALDVSLWLLVSALVISVALALGLGGATNVALPSIEPRLWPWLIAGGVAGAAIPTTAFMAGITRIGPSRTAILMTFEPVVGVSLAALLLGERPLALQFVGGAAVIAAAVLLQTMPLHAQAVVEPPLV